jgi:hypothetical protein
MYSDNIKRQNETLEKRGIPSHSHFHIEFEDGSTITEHGYNWSDISEEIVVDHFGSKKIAVSCTHPIKAITINHAWQSVIVRPEKGERVYQSIRSNAVLQSDGRVISYVIGRVVGRIKDGVVIEEQVIDNDGKIWGMKL